MVPLVSPEELHYKMATEVKGVPSSLLSIFLSEAALRGEKNLNIISSVPLTQCYSVTAEETGILEMPSKSVTSYLC